MKPPVCYVFKARESAGLLCALQTQKSNVLCLLSFSNSYGLKSVNGVNRLSGEGLEAKDVPGMMQGGGKWPGRWVL